MMIISGGQTGADRGALEAAREKGVPYGGWVPFDRKAEDGAVPNDFENMRETDHGGYTTRTRRNVRDSDATLLIALMGAGGLTPGSRLTQRLCEELKKPLLILPASWVLASPEGQATDVVHWMGVVFKGRELNVAGTRESKCPGLQAATQRLILKVFELWDARRAKEQSRV